MEVRFTPSRKRRYPKSPGMPVRISGGCWTVAENSLAEHGRIPWRASAKFELVGGPSTPQDDKIFQFRGNTVSATVPW
jgi:hypothetical protein